MRGVGLLVLAILAAACGSTPLYPTGSAGALASPGPSGGTAASPSVVPWTDATTSPESVAASVPPGTPACTAARVLAEAGWQGGGGSMIGSIWVTNEGDLPCALAGPPRLVRLISGSAAVSPLAFDARPQAGDEITAEAPPVLLYLGGRSIAWLVWSNWCAAVRPAVTAVLVTLPDGSGPVRATRMDPGFSGVPRCDVPAAGSTLTASAFQPAEPTAPAPKPVGVAVAAPSVAAPGSELDYTVTLTNVGPEPVALDPCPFYTESIFAGGAALKAADRRLLLNCAGAGSAIAPGSTTLQMRDVVPADAPVGPAELRWTLDPGGPLALDPATATAAFMITGR